MKKLKTLQAALIALWIGGELCGMYLLVAAAAVLGSMSGTSLGEVFCTLMTTVCCAAGGLVLMCMGHAAKELLYKLRAAVRRISREATFLGG